MITTFSGKRLGLRDVLIHADECDIVSLNHGSEHAKLREERVDVCVIHVN